MKIIVLIVHLHFNFYLAVVSLIPDKIDEDLRLYWKNETHDSLEFIPFVTLIEENQDTSEFWRETEILSLLRNVDVDQEHCEPNPNAMVVHVPSLRTVRPICRNWFDYHLCPQCPHINNFTECELFKDSCRERRVAPTEYRTYCDKKYGKWRTMFLPADYSQCRCCDECVFYRELDQSCVADDYLFDNEEFLPVTTIDFRAGCNPYWGHPEQETRALRCDRLLRRWHVEIFLFVILYLFTT